MYCAARAAQDEAPALVAPERRAFGVGEQEGTSLSSRIVGDEAQLRRLGHEIVGHLDTAADEPVAVGQAQATTVRG